MDDHKMYDNNKCDQKKKKFKNKAHKHGSYLAHRSHSSMQKPVRNFVRSYINHFKNNLYILEDFIYPSTSSTTYNWWDVTPRNPKVL